VYCIFCRRWISPIPVNTPGGYHGYWALDLEKVNPFFGSEQDLLALVAACHARNMYVMLDVVMNHMGNLGYDYSDAVPFNRAEYYHDCDSCPQQCDIQDYQCFNGQIELCRLSGLPDLNQSHPLVSTYLIEWSRAAIAHFGFDGLRLDTVPEVSRDFWTRFQREVGVYAVGEVWSDLQCTAAFQEVLDGVLSYPMCFTLRDCFQNDASLTQLAEQQMALAQQMRNISWLGTFVDNHDNARFLNDSSATLPRYQSALAYVLLSSGIPIVYYGRCPAA
jgi:alpha-amylase